MKINVIAVPYDSGRRGERMGAGPLRLLDAGLPKALEKSDFTVSVETMELPADMWTSEVSSAFNLADQVADKVRDALANNAFPLILSGNCLPAAMGAARGIGLNYTSVFWFDAHGDFNTPESTLSGFVDGMALASICGRCWSKLAKGTKINERNVVLIGARDIDDPEAEILRTSSVTRVRIEGFETQLANALRARSRGASYVHVDLDVLDSSAATINQFASAGGLSFDQLEWSVREIGKAAEVNALSITAFDPAFDKKGDVAKKAMELIPKLVRAARSSA
jgi:arginase